MIGFKKLIEQQEGEVSLLRKIADDAVRQKISPNNDVSGVLLTGSVSRGDARVGPFGVMIDLAIVVNNRKDFDPEPVFGPDEEPLIPFHCVNVQDKISIAAEILEEPELWEIREESEARIFAMNESVILYDKTGKLSEWKKECFSLNAGQIKERAMRHYYRFCYLTGEYRFEKWNHREAWSQLSQIFNEANECYCSFLHCINGGFVPRKDWLVYLTYDLDILPERHQDYINKIYAGELSAEAMEQKFRLFQEMKSWMEEVADGD